MMHKYRGGNIGDRFENQGVEPLTYMPNLADIMLVFACGLMLALIINWNVELSPVSTYAVEPGSGEAGGTYSINTGKAVAFQEQDLKEMKKETNLSGSGGMEKLGEVYYDAKSGTYYIVAPEDAGQ